MAGDLPRTASEIEDDFRGYYTLRSMSAVTALGNATPTPSPHSPIQR
jgi:hypothetical protein